MKTLSVIAKFKAAGLDVVKDGAGAPSPSGVVLVSYHAEAPAGRLSFYDQGGEVTAIKFLAKGTADHAEYDSWESIYYHSIKPALAAAGVSRAGVAEVENTAQCHGRMRTLTHECKELAARCRKLERERDELEGHARNMASHAEVGSCQVKSAALEFREWLAKRQPRRA
jgi:hypothetical protein